ncbi:MAG TPA: hypothetical protein VF210_06375 [Pseudomonadales bacterium]
MIEIRRRTSNIAALIRAMFANSIRAMFAVSILARLRFDSGHVAFADGREGRGKPAVAVRMIG